MSSMLKILVQLGMSAVAFIPTALFFILCAAIAPVGFWQVFAVIAAGIPVFGGFQTVFLMLLLSFSISMWQGEDKE